MPESTRKNMARGSGVNNPCWIGGRAKCEICNKTLSGYHTKRCRKHRVVTDKMRKNLSRAMEGINTWTKGRKLSKETRTKISIATSGEKNKNWIKDRTKLQKFGNTNQDRRSSAYRDWRWRVWTRDSFRCKMNDKNCKGRLEAHHILGFTDSPKSRYDINNGITLCHAHHPRKRVEEAKLSPIFKKMVAEMK